MACGLSPGRSVQNHHRKGRKGTRSTLPSPVSPMQSQELRHDGENHTADRQVEHGVEQPEYHLASSFCPIPPKDVSPPPAARQPLLYRVCRRELVHPAFQEHGTSYVVGHGRRRTPLLVCRSIIEFVTGDLVPSGSRTARASFCTALGLTLDCACPATMSHLSRTLLSPGLCSSAQHGCERHWPRVPVPPALFSARLDRSGGMLIVF